MTPVADDGRAADASDGSATGPFDFEPIFPADTAPTIDVLGELNGRLARFLPSSPLGRSLLGLTQHLGEAIDSQRFTIAVREGEGLTGITFDLNLGRFVQDERDLHELLSEVPSGLVCWRQDLEAVLVGRLQVWEMCTAAARQWHPRLAPEETPAGFLYTHLSEYVRPDLASALYQGQPA